MLVKTFFQKIQALEKSIFLFSLFYFSQLWRTLARKLMERPIVFITYFESPFQIVHVYQVFRSGYFFQKFYDGFNIISIFDDLVSKLLWLCARSQNFVIWKFFIKIWRLFQNVNNILFISATLSNICSKTYEKPYHFFTYIQSSTLFLHVYKISWSPIYIKKNAAYFNMLTKACLFQQLWTIFWTKIVKNPSIFVTYIFTSFQFLHAYLILLRSHFYNKNDRGFNVANKQLLISKSVFIAPLF